MMPKNIKVQKEGTAIFIKWEDGKENIIPTIELRRLCPCALCLTEKVEESKSDIPVYSGAQTRIEDLTVVWNFALQIKWEDGHNTGIYKYIYLKKIAEM